MGTDLSELLSAYKQEKSGSKIAQPAPMRESYSMPSSNTISGSVDMLNNMVYGELTEADQPGGYDPKREMELIKSGYSGKKVNKSTVPNPIFEEMMQNPIDTSVFAVDEEVDKMAEKIAGIQKANKISQKLDEYDKSKMAQKQTLNENVAPRQTAGIIDYSLIKAIVSQAIDEKIELLRSSMVNEDLNHSSFPGLMMIRQTDDGKTLFMDSNNEVYEMRLVHKGKAKVNRK